MTAGHCCYLSEDIPLIIVAGDHSITIDEGSEQTANVTKMMLHPKFQFIYPPGIPVWDACILKLDKKLEMNQYVQPVALPKPDEEFSGYANISGWGFLTEDGPLFDALQVVKVPVYSMQECSDEYPFLFKESNMICKVPDPRVFA